MPSEAETAAWGRFEFYILPFKNLSKKSSMFSFRLAYMLGKSRTTQHSAVSGWGRRAMVSKALSMPVSALLSQ